MGRLKHTANKAVGGKKPTKKPRCVTALAENDKNFCARVFGGGSWGPRSHLPCPASCARTERLPWTVSFSRCCSRCLVQSGVVRWPVSGVGVRFPTARRRARPFGAKRCACIFFVCGQLVGRENKTLPPEGIRRARCSPLPSQDSHSARVVFPGCSADSPPAVPQTRCSLCKMMLFLVRF